MVRPKLSQVLAIWNPYRKSDRADTTEKKKNSSETRVVSDSGHS